MGMCLKCGRETTEKAAFCDQCQTDMARYPVKPGTVIHLPKRQAVPEKKADLYGEPDNTRQIAGLQKTVRFLTVLVAVLSVLLIIMACLMIHMLPEETPSLPIGRNYTTVDTSHQP